MSTETLKCADNVGSVWQSRRASIKAMLDPSAEDLTIESHATNDVQILLDGQRAICWLSHDELRDIAERVIDPSDLADYPGDPADRSQWPAEMREQVLSEIFDDHEDEIREAGREMFYEYGLGFDYVAPETFPDQREGYWRYQISYGGPSEEIRFFASRMPGGWSLYRAEFWYLDWFDGAPVDVTEDVRELGIWQDFEECGQVEATLEAAISSET